uniref:Uncharacterized protein n=1 Tax=Hyaloperonospora arabidopsidis (strain Emoy2) TaxID=559515 RepID=M4BT74_HYAAE
MLRGAMSEGSEGQRLSDPSQVQAYLSSALSASLPYAEEMAKRLERRPIESVTASVSSLLKVREAEATSHVWSMSPHAEAVSGVVAIAEAMTVARRTPPTE